MYNIPKEMSSEMKFTKSIYLFDIASVMIALGIAWIFEGLVYPKLIVLYYVYIIGGTIFLVSKSKANPKKRKIQSIYLFLTRNKQCYSRY